MLSYSRFSLSAAVLSRTMLTHTFPGKQFHSLAFGVKVHGRCVAYASTMPVCGMDLQGLFEDRTLNTKITTQALKYTPYSLSLNRSRKTVHPKPSGNLMKPIAAGALSGFGNPVKFPKPDMSANGFALLQGAL